MCEHAFIQTPEYAAVCCECGFVDESERLLSYKPSFFTPKYPSKQQAILPTQSVRIRKWHCVNQWQYRLHVKYLEIGIICPAAMRLFEYYDKKIRCKVDSYNATALLCYILYTQTTYSFNEILQRANVNRKNQIDKRRVIRYAAYVKERRAESGIITIRNWIDSFICLTKSERNALYSKLCQMRASKGAIILYIYFYIMYNTAYGKRKVTRHLTAIEFNKLTTMDLHNQYIKDVMHYLHLSAYDYPPAAMRKIEHFLRSNTTMRPELRKC